MSLVGSATIRKIAQSFSVCAALRGASSARARSAIEARKSRVEGVLALVLLGAVAPGVAFAQSEVRRPVRQVETDDGVIEITNSHEAVAHPSSEETTSVRASSAVDRGGEPQAKGAQEPSAHDHSTGAAQASTAASSSWWLPLLVVAIAGGTCVWGVRRRNFSRASSTATPGAIGSDVSGRIEALSEASDLRAGEGLEADVDEPAPFVAPAAQLAAPPGQWVDAVRDSVPPSSPPRSSRSANAPRQWVSQPLRVKSDES